MDDANEEKRTSLSVPTNDLGAEFQIALLGPADGAEYNDHVMGMGSSVFEENSPHARTNRAVQAKSLDTCLSGKKPDFLKLDVQGFEIEVMKGATNVLTQVAAVLLELSLIEINKGAPLFTEVVAFLDERGFAPLDILEIHRRPLDMATDQIDFIFVRKESELLADIRHY